LNNKSKNIFDYLWLFGLGKFRIAFLIGVTLSAALLEGFGMAMFLPVLEYIEKGQSLEALKSSSELWEKLLQVFEFLSLEVTLLSLLSAAIFVMLLRVFAVYARQVYGAWLGQEMQHTARTNIFNAIMTTDYMAYTSMTSGGAVNVLTTEMQRAVGSFSALFALLANITVIAALIAILIWISGWLTLIATTFVLLSGVIVTFYLRHTKKISHGAASANDAYSRRVFELLGAFRLIKLSAMTGRELKNARLASAQVKDRLYMLAKLAARIDLIMEPTVLIAGGGILYSAIILFKMSLSEVGIFLLILLRLLPLAKEVLRSYQTYNASFGSVSAVLRMYEESASSVERNHGSAEFQAPKKYIRFENISFSYPNSDVSTLRDISIDIPAGKMTALVGPSGAGKTTLVDLIPRLHIPDAGKIYFDDIESSEFELGSLRNGIAFVSQDATIFNCSVEENLLFVNDGASSEEITDALETARAFGFVNLLDRGLDTVLGERGAKLSGGQKQRLALARSLLQKAKILILDEPTSALDYETEREIRESLELLRAQTNLTIIVIAHRLSTIKGADQIVVIKDGQVVHQGSHEDLLLAEDWYARALEGSS